MYDAMTFDVGPFALRAAVIVDELLITDDTIVGVRGHGKDANRVEEHARMVIGTVARNGGTAPQVDLVDCGRRESIE